MQTLSLFYAILSTGVSWMWLKENFMHFPMFWIIFMVMTIPGHIVMTWWHVFPGSHPAGYDSSSLDKNFQIFIL